MPSITPEKQAYDRLYRARHRDSIRAVSRVYRDANRESVRKYAREWRMRNKQRLGVNAEYWRKYYAAHRQQRIETSRKYRVKNRERIRAKMAARYVTNKTVLLERTRKWRIANPEKMKAGQRRYVEANKKHRSAIQSKYICERKKRDPAFRILMNCRLRIWEALKSVSGRKAARTECLLGCTVLFFKQFLQDQFVDGMSWDNYGETWQIDHVIPISHFDLTVPEQQCKAFHYSNCRPLCKYKNASRGNKSPGQHQPRLL